MKDCQYNAMKVKCLCKFPYPCSSLLLRPCYKSRTAMLVRRCMDMGLDLRPGSLSTLASLESSFQWPDLCGSHWAYVPHSRYTSLPASTSTAVFSYLNWSDLVGSFHFTSGDKHTTQHTFTSAPREQLSGSHHPNALQNTQRLQQ